MNSFSSNAATKPCVCYATIPTTLSSSQISRGISMRNTRIRTKITPRINARLKLLACSHSCINSSRSSKSRLPKRQDAERSTRASYAVSLLIAKKMHPFTDADFVKDCILAAVDVICPEQHDAFMAIPLSARTATRRVEDLASDVRSSMLTKFKSLGIFSIALDESCVTSRTLRRWPSLCVASRMT